MEALRATLSVLNQGRSIATGAVVGYTIYNLYDQAIADLLGLRTRCQPVSASQWAWTQLTGQTTPDIIFDSGRFKSWNEAKGEQMDRMSGVRGAIGLLIGFLSPVTKYRSHSEEETDIGLSFLGISGSLIQAVKHPNIFKRYRKSPSLPLLGLLELSAALLLTSRCWPSRLPALPSQLGGLWASTPKWVAWPVVAATVVTTG